MTLRVERSGAVVTCEHQYSSMATGKRKIISVCDAKFVTFSVGLVALDQAKAAGWEAVRFPGGVQHFCPEHTRKALAERSRAERQTLTVRKGWL